MSNTSKYEYKAINGPKTIRVLRLSGGSSDILFADLVEMNLSSPWPYEAISYVWGSSQKPHMLYLSGGASIKITQSLFNALKDIRPSTIEDGPRFLWADGVCINQEDTAEQSQQVQLMGEIYRAALSVITYVGQDTLDVEKGIDLAKKLVSTSTKLKKGHDSTTDSNFNAKYQVPDATDPAWPSLRDFVGRTWYTRMWIIQESVLNKNGSIVCGKTIIPWELFLALAHLFAQSTFNQFFLITPYSEKQIGALNWMAELRTNYQIRPKTVPLLALLSASREFDCSDPRDRVFAVSSLLAGPSSITPDYGKSTRCVFIEAAEMILQTSGLAVLSYAGLRKNREIPSWVPDWSVPSEQVPIFQSRIFNGLSNLGQQFIPADLEAGKLRISGCVFDRVIHVSNTLRRAFITGRMSRYEWARDQYSRLTRSGTMYTGGGTWLEAFWRTLILDLNPDKRDQHHSALSKVGAHFESYVRPNKMWAHKEAINSIAKYQPENSPKPPEIESVVMESWRRESKLGPPYCHQDHGEHNVFSSLQSKHSTHQDSRGNEYRDLVLKAQSLYRTLFTTERGYIGMSAQEIGENDFVAFLPGAQVPFLLRGDPGGSTYSLVGDCYVHGLMNGEVLKHSQWRTQSICLV